VNLTAFLNRCRVIFIPKIEHIENSNKKEYLFMVVMYRKLSYVTIIFLCLLAVTCIFTELPARPVTAITDNSSLPSTDTKSISSTVILEGPPTESEGPLSWWLITIIVVGGLVIVLVTWRLVRKSDETSTK
jgi:hypothetical protein